MMNDLLFKLADEARQYADSLPEAGYEAKIWRNAFNSKYAELIVRECEKAIMSADDYPVGTIASVHRMKKHLGVTE